MLLIFGFTIRFKTTRQLVFFCPSCGGDRPGLARTARRWFTLFWLPVIPLRTIGEVVECGACSSRFDPAVADAPTTAAISRLLDDARRALTVMMVATGDRQDRQLRLAATASIAEVVADYREASLDGDLAVLDPAIADRYVAPLVDTLDVSGKERFVGGLVQVALAGGTITPDQRRVVDLAGKGLALTPVHVTGIVSSVASGRGQVTPPPPPPATDVPPA